MGQRGVEQPLLQIVHRGLHFSSLSLSLQAMDKLAALCYRATSCKFCNPNLERW